jgi:hypothetical protein
LTGAASGGIAEQLKRKAAKLLTEPVSFLVEGTQGPLVEGEQERARALLAAGLRDHCSAMLGDDDSASWSAVGV